MLALIRVRNALGNTPSYRGSNISGADSSLIGGSFSSSGRDFGSIDERPASLSTGSTLSTPAASSDHTQLAVLMDYIWRHSAFVILFMAQLMCSIVARALFLLWVWTQGDVYMLGWWQSLLLLVPSTVWHFNTGIRGEFLHC